MKKQQLNDRFHIFNFSCALNSLLISGILLLILMTTQPMQAQSAMERCQSAADKVDLNGYEMISTLIISDAKNRKRERKIISARSEFGKTSKMLMKFVEPADVRGTAMLVYDHKNKQDDMWIYLPALRKPRRIISKEKSKSFMGSEFNNSDMSEPDPNDFDYLSMGTEKLMGNEHEIIRLTCKNKKIAGEYGYAFKQQWIDLKSGLNTRIDYFDQSGKPLRQQNFLDYQKLGTGKFYAGTMSIENYSNKRKSMIRIEKVKEIKELRENYFLPSNLGEL